MLELKLIRDKTAEVRDNFEKRKDPSILRLLDEVVEKDKRFRELNQQTEELRARRNKVSLEVNKAKKAGKDASKLLAEAKEIPEKIKSAEAESEKLKESLRNGLMRLPNLLHESVPYGASGEDNKVVKEVGGREVPEFGVKSHVDLLGALDVCDIERAAKISGARFYFLKNELVLLDLALQKFALDLLAKKGFVPVQPPFMMRREPYEGVTDLKDFEDVMYKVDGEDLYLIATSEHPIAAMHSGEVLPEEALPLKYAGLSACFRKEAGAHGKDTKGIFRVHQFNKIEQFVFCKPEDSWRIHEQLLANAEQFFSALEIPYRVVNICTGDIGAVAAKKYDVEAWMPAQGVYREVTSCSNCTSYQAVRLNVKYGKYGGEKDFVHTLNSTMVATGRAMVAIMENHQQEDGSVKIPKALKPYMNGLGEIRREKK